MKGWLCLCSKGRLTMSSDAYVCKYQWSNIASMHAVISGLSFHSRVHQLDNLILLCIFLRAKCILYSLLKESMRSVSSIWLIYLWNAAVEANYTRCDALWFSAWSLDYLQLSNTCTLYNISNMWYNISPKGSLGHFFGIHTNWPDSS